MRLGQRGRETREQFGIGLDARLDERPERVFVHGFRPEDDRQGLDCSSPCDPDVNHRVRPAFAERLCRPRCRLHRSDPATEHLEAADVPELTLSGGDDQHTADPSPRAGREYLGRVLRGVDVRVQLVDVGSLRARSSFAVPLTGLLHGVQSGTTTLPDTPIAPRWMCAPPSPGR